MSELNCNACNDLQEYAPDFVDYGVTDEIADSLAANTGLNPNLDVLHEDCEDLNDANDCLIGMMENDVESFRVCDWQDFMKEFIGNLYNMLKAMIASICGLWHKLEVSSYYGLAELYTTTDVYGGDDVTPVTVPFNRLNVSGNMPDGVFTSSSSYNSITITNTLSAPLLINATFNCSLSTTQRLACCYISVSRDGNTIGQTPFITPTSYDQQVMAEPFFLDPGESTTLSYIFSIGQANSWFKTQFGSGTTKCYLVRSTAGSVASQGSYFIVQASTVVSN